MKKILLYSFLILSIQYTFAQNNNSWKGYFSYNNIVDITQSATNVIASTNNAVFSQNITTAAIKKTTTIEGLSGEKIAAICYSESLKKTIIGYENGLITVVNENDGSVYKAIGIIQKQLPSSLKKINHLYEKNGVVYVSCKFGIVQFFLNNLEFGDTYFLGSTLTDYQEVLQTTIYNGALYAVTQSNGIKKGILTNPNLNDFSQWQVFDGGYWNGVEVVNNQLVASNTDGNLYKWNGTNWANLYSGVGGQVIDFRSASNHLIVTLSNKVLVFDATFQLLYNIPSSYIANNNPVFTVATIQDNTIYIGTTKSGLFTVLGTTGAVANITPNGPYRNAIFRLNAQSDKLWAVYGGYSSDYNPYTYNADGLDAGYPVSNFSDSGWKDIPNSSLFNAKAISNIAVNPTNKKQVYFSCYYSGILKFDNDLPVILYNSQNSGLENSYAPSDLRVGGGAFDKSGNFWVSVSRIKNALRIKNASNTWQSVSIEPISSDFLQSDYNNIVIDKNGTKWIATYKDGVIAYNENANPKFKKLTNDVNIGNLPNSDVRCVALDNKNQLWIGTINGLRVLYSIDDFTTEVQPKAASIIILEDNLAQELFYEQFIKDIVVDGANRKWVGTAESGVFLVSPDGQETIYHFTKDNSPLPSNAILDIEIDGTTGEVFFATDNGLVSFKGTSTKASDNLENVYVYPNPVRPEFEGTVKISGLLSKANVKITDIEGNLVHETTSEGGTIEWDTTAFGKYKVASGVYLIFVAAQDGLETKVKKVMIIR